jgi:hypothetical protein
MAKAAGPHATNHIPYDVEVRETFIIQILILNDHLAASPAQSIKVKEPDSFYNF